MRRDWRGIAAVAALACSLGGAGEARATQCSALGAAQPYNGLFFEAFSAVGSDVEGALAVGGNLSLNHYSIADKLPSTFQGPSLVVGGNASFPSGRVYVGDIHVGGSAAGIGQPVLAGLSASQQVFDGQGTPLDFVAARAELVTLSERLAQLDANGSYEARWGGLYLNGDCSSETQVFNLPGALVLSAHTFQVSCIPDQATVVFNIDGVSPGLTNMSLQSLAPHRRRVLFNFYQAETLTFRGIGVEGS